MYNLDSIFHSPAYLRITQRRLEHLASLGLSIAGKEVLDVGAGIGDFASFYLDHGCQVTALEPRQDNVELLKRNLEQSGAAARGKLKIVEEDFWAIERMDLTYEIINAYGVLYHLNDPLRALKSLRKCCGGILLLETCVTNRNGETQNVVPEPSENTSQAIDGLGCRPNRCWLYNELSELFPHVYMPLTQPRHEQFPTEWSMPHGADTLQRSIYVASDQAIVLSSLYCGLIEKHEIK